MPWPVHPNGLLGAQGDNDTYKIERSLRFNSADSAYLNRTNSGSPTNAIKYTISVWAKRGVIGSNQNILGVRNSGTDDSYFRFTSTDEILIGSYSGAGTDYNITSSGVFRDPSAWYHIVCVFDSANLTTADRAILYVNGVRQAVTTPGNGMWPRDSTLNKLNTASQVVNLGRRPAFNDLYLDAYLTEFNFIDGQALTPSSFGETDAITGRWKAKAYSGTYGTNGFYLKFADNSSTAALGTDSSGNGNTWTPNNFSVTAGAGNDSLVDSPTNYGSDTGAGGTLRGNYCTMNPLEGRSNRIIPQDGNILVSLAAGANAYFGSRSTIGVSSGKWYWEATVTARDAGAGSWLGVGVVSENVNWPAGNGLGSNNGGYEYLNDGFKWGNASLSSYGSSWNTNDIIGVALDCDNQTIVFYKNGTSQGTAFTGIGSGAPFFPTIEIYRSTGVTQSLYTNFGQRPFAYTAPTGFKALCTTNLTTPTIKKPSSYIDAVAYTGTGASNSISSLGFSPDLVWIKNRGGATSHAIYDTTRLATKQLSSDTTGDEATSSTGLTAFGSNGFTLGTSTLVNTSGTQYVAWAWDESPIAGMDIVSYTGNGANRTIAHTIGVAPKMLIVKARTTAGADQGWPVWHTSIANTTYLTLSTTSATATGTDYWNSTSPTSSVFSIGTNAAVNTSADTYIAYAFAEVEGFSKFGSYTGNGSTDGPFVWCGFRPRWVMIKSVMASTNWIMFDTARSTYNQINDHLGANTSSAENFTANESIDVTSNGFKVRNTNTDINYSTYTHIFAAFAEAPFKYARAR